MAYASAHHQPWTRDRLIAATAAIAVQALLGFALLSGLTVRFPQQLQESLKLFTSEAPPPPPPPRVVPTPKTAAKRPEGRASPPNLRSRATEVAAPVPVIVLPLPIPVITAPRPFVANDAMSGSAAVRGPGTGAGGIGDGFGSGGNGNGDGGGGRDETGPRFLRGRLSISDLPESIFTTGFHGTVGVRYVVARNGRVPDCEVTRSSGNTMIDDVTCRMIRDRFRFRPSLDGAGRPIESMVVENHTWDVDADVVETVETARRRSRLP